MKTKNNRLLSYSQAIAEACIQEMERDKNVFLLGLDVDDHKSIQGSTSGILKKFGKNRIFSTPLSEDAMTGVAIGAAMAGLRPIHVHIRMDFLLLAMNQLINIAAKSHYMYNGQLSVPLVIRAMVGRSWGQGAQHSQSFHSLFMNIPGIKVVAPTNSHDVKGSLISSIRDNNPVIFMEHRLLYNQKSYVPRDLYTIEIGKGRVLKKGSDVTIVGISHMVIESLRAGRILEHYGLNAEIIDPISLKPLDINLINNSFRKTNKLLIVDNGWKTCGIGAEIISQILEKNPIIKNPKIARMGFAESPCPTTKSLENLFYPSAIEIAEKALSLFGKKIKISQKNLKWENEIDEFKGPF